jgi:hypothetical protein
MEEENPRNENHQNDERILNRHRTPNKNVTIIQDLSKWCSGNKECRYMHLDLLSFSLLGANKTGEPIHHVMIDNMWITMKMMEWIEPTWTLMNASKSNGDLLLNK